MRPLRSSFVFALVLACRAEPAAEQRSEPEARPLHVVQPEVELPPVGSLVVIADDAPLFTAAKDDAKQLPARDRIGTSDRADGRGRVARVVGVEDGFLRIENLGPDEGVACASGFHFNAVARLRMFVRPGALMPVLKQRKQVELDDGTTLELVAGTPVVGSSAALGNRELAVGLSAAEIGRWYTSTPGETCVGLLDAEPPAASAEPALGPDKRCKTIDYFAAEHTPLTWSEGGAAGELIAAQVFPDSWNENGPERCVNLGHDFVVCTELESILERPNPECIERRRLAGVGVVDFGRELELELGEPTVDGPLATAGIRRVFEAHRDELLACYNKAARRSPKLAGRVVVGFEVAGDGKVLSSEVESSTLDDAVAARCIAAAVEPWSFPLGEPVRVVEAIDLSMQ